MNRNIATLHAIAAKPVRRIIGLMSGTSLDGLDIALCEIGGHGATMRLELLEFATVGYDRAFLDALRQVFAREQVDLRELTRLNAIVGDLHGRMILDCLADWSIAAGDVDLIASHGQTVMHAPRVADGPAAATLQIGDGDHVAMRTGIPTLSDFRQKHIAAGGEGAPSAVYGDALLFRHAAERRILLNMGGIANFTCLPPLTAPEPIFVTDTGPGNTMLDALARVHLPELGYDRDACLARAGAVNSALLAALKDHAFFERPPPKTTGPELFNLDYLAHAQQRSGTGAASASDLMATLTRFSAETIADAVRRVPGATEAVLYASGGGVHNPLLMVWLSEALGRRIARTDALGVLADAKEAVLFAVLANEAVAGHPDTFAAVRASGYPAVAMGKLSFAA